MYVFIVYIVIILSNRVDSLFVLDVFNYPTMWVLSLVFFLILVWKLSYFSVFVLSVKCGLVGEFL